MASQAPDSYAEKLAQLEELRREAAHAQGPAVEKQHAKGKFTARERSRSCSTPAPSRSSTASSATARPISAWRKNRPLGDAVVTGYGTIDGRQVCVFSQDFTVFGGSLGEVWARRSAR